MKNYLTVLKIYALLVVSFLPISKSHGQECTWVKAQYSSCYYHTSPGATFTWSGDCKNGYCDGYGTIQYYDNGNLAGKLVGRLVQGKVEGYATQYYEDGSIYLQGNYVNDEYENLYQLSKDANDLGFYVMNEVFDGGTNLNCEIIDVIDAKNGNKEIRIKVKFNGNIVQENKYSITLILTNNFPFVDFTANDRAMGYIVGKYGTKAFLELIKDHKKE